MTSHNYRHRARQHVQRAKDHLADGKSETLRYACLELRMAIEALTYERLEAYLSEVSNDVMKKWQPKQVLAELLFVDPTADSSGQLWVGREDQPGVPAKDMKFLGTDERFTVKWATKAHNTLGGFLHEPTIAQLQAGKENEATIRERAAEIVTELERVLSATLSNVNFGVFCTIPCECGFTIRRKEEFVRRGENAVCASCGRIYEVSIKEETRQFAYKLARVNYECANCKTEQWIARHELDKEPVLVCSTCDSKAKVVRVFSLEEVPVKSAAE
jgi:DNA-directed RNA polymerase subunit RPC12/RpoP